MPLPSGYRLREATIADIDALARHRTGMFADMGVEYDVERLDAAFRRWLSTSMPAGVYRAWLVDAGHGALVAGGGITIIPWPPGPQYPGGRIAFVYNVYTEPGWRNRGLARAVMEAIHDWCRQADISSVALNASQFGRPMYESMGYQVSPSPTMFLALK
jgi:GNAT superfamily N-acetyltransferase